jgi:hypothetical protein
VTGVAGRTTAGQPGRQASVAPVANRPGTTPSRPTSTWSGGNRPAAGQPSSPTVGSRYPSTAGQGARPTSTWIGTSGTSPSSTPTARPTKSGGATQLASLARPTSTWTGASRGSTGFVGTPGARSYASSSSFSSRPSAGFSGAVSAPSRSFSSPSAGARNFSGSPSGGFSGGRGGGPFSGSSGGFSGGSRGNGGGRR